MNITGISILVFFFGGFMFSKAAPGKPWKYCEAEPDHASFNAAWHTQGYYNHETLQLNTGQGSMMILKGDGNTFHIQNWANSPIQYSMRHAKYPKYWIEGVLPVRETKAIYDGPPGHIWVKTYKS